MQATAVTLHLALQCKTSDARHHKRNKFAFVDSFDALL